MHHGYRCFSKAQHSLLLTMTICTNQLYALPPVDSGMDRPIGTGSTCLNLPFSLLFSTVEMISQPQEALSMSPKLDSSQHP